MSHLRQILGTVLILLILAVSSAIFDVDRDGSSYLGGDCQPFNVALGTDAKEIAFDGIDQNCDGRDFESTDEEDRDADGFSVLRGDCDDEKHAINPQAIEISDDLDNDCDLLIDEKNISIDLIKSPIIPATGSRNGLTGQSFLTDISATQLKLIGTGKIYEGKLLIEATTKSATFPNAASKWTAVKIYLGAGNARSFWPLEERYLDATWRGNGSNNLKIPDDALERGGMFYAGQSRKMEFNLRAVPVSAKSFNNSKKEELDLISMLSKQGENGLILGFFTSTPGFGKINSASIVLEVDEALMVEAKKL